MNTKLCETCQGVIVKAKWEGKTRWSNHKYCSNKCRPAWNKGLDKSDERVAKYLKGSEATRFSTQRSSGENSPAWRGDEASYSAKHIWVRNHYGPASKCENTNCEHKSVTFQWANISGSYKRDRDDWQQLCVPCHKGNDIKALGGKIKAKPVFIQPTKVCVECRTEFSKNPKLSKAQWEKTVLCSKACSALSTARKNKGTRQSNETRALKSERLKERWATNEEWRIRMTEKMTGNQYAKKQ